MKQDRFKFRAWSKEEKEYYYDAEKTHDYFNGIMSESFGELLEDDRYIIEQCTGIKDRNGKLIYEGDLVRLMDGAAFKKQGVVEWRSLYGNTGAWQVAEYSLAVHKGLICYLLSSAWEVYGNIQETEIKK